MPAPHDGFSGMPAFAGGKTVELARGSLASREKKTFKDKLLTLIQEAEAQEQQAMREAQMQDKKTLAIQLLVEGRPQAFTDFFNLTHPPPASAPKQAAMSSNQGDSGAESTSGQDHEVPQEALTFLSSELLRADNALRSGDLQTVYAAYKSLAKYFAQIGKLTKAEFFFQRCLGISQDGGWLAGELEANLALGVVYDELKDNASAIACYERRLDLAASHNLALQHDTAWTNLTAVYLRQAQVQESSGDANSALECYAHCLNAAAHAGDEATAARAHFRTGMLHFGAERYEEALQSLMRFMEVRGALGDKEAEGLAFTTFADCKMLLGDTDGAIHSLEQYLQVGRWCAPA